MASTRTPAGELHWGQNRLSGSDRRSVPGRKEGRKPGALGSTNTRHPKLQIQAWKEGQRIVDARIGVEREERKEISGLVNNGDFGAEISGSDLVLQRRVLNEPIMFPLEKLEPNTGQMSRG